MKKNKKEEKINYKCAECGASGCKLWMFHRWLYVEKLICANCALAGEKLNFKINSEGCHITESGKETDRIGIYLPATLNKEMSGFHIYHNTPQDRVDWWINLPTYPKK